MCTTIILQILFCVNSNKYTTRNSFQVMQYNCFWWLRLHVYVNNFNFNLGNELFLKHIHMRFSCAQWSIQGVSRPVQPLRFPHTTWLHSTAHVIHEADAERSVSRADGSTGCRRPKVVGRRRGRALSTEELGGRRERGCYISPWVMSRTGHPARGRRCQNIVKHDTQQLFFTRIGRLICGKILYTITLLCKCCLLSFFLWFSKSSLNCILLKQIEAVLCGLFCV